MKFKKEKDEDPDYEITYDVECENKAFKGKAKCIKIVPEKEHLQQDYDTELQKVCPTILKELEKEKVEKKID